MRALTIFVNIFPSGGGYAYLQNMKGTQIKLEQVWGTRNINSLWKKRTDAENTSTYLENYAVL
jgi:hypothetical protein